ncbi:hypothetical protein Amet_3861 [Alkaliphilus metalliredigens QYMF]|uniref:Uncharacterized protein n=1 Tax=Alkaliphilus metalliredigens (strain QYMF) TaxID=293826 RepID=A6TUV6_ALKMQ|nr:hypothetical protein [Alkaliphilus metalliredigens]ABR49974.1 hypothetical protein Amet_3861 [Alkaliphilus metalliredigens QYMF]
MFPNYEYDGQDPIEKLIYDTEIKGIADKILTHYSDYEDDLDIPIP